MIGYFLPLHSDWRTPVRCHASRAANGMEENSHIEPSGQVPVACLKLEPGGFDLILFSCVRLSTVQYSTVQYKEPGRKRK